MDADATLLVSVPETRLEERRYALDVVLRDWFGLDYVLAFHTGARVSVRLAGAPDEPGLELPDVLFATSAADWLTERSMPHPPVPRLPSPVGGSIPVLFGAGAHRDSAGEAGEWLPIDVFGSVFFLLTRYEEVVIRERVEHDWFPARASIAAAENVVERALADEYVVLLWAAMKARWPRLVRRATTFRLRPTHDVDQPWGVHGRRRSAVARSLAADLVVRREPRLALRRIQAIFDARAGRVDRDPLNTFELLMETSERHGLRSTFYFLAGNVPGDADFRYDISDPAIVALLRRVHDRGHEIGLHASYASHRSADRTAVEAAALRDACRAAGIEQASFGVRQHYLRFEAATSWRDQAAAGLEHDSTLGFAERVGFRAGTCREFPVFDLLQRRPLALRERPLVAMDATLLRILGVSPEEAATSIASVVDTCRRHAGDAVLLYHNSSLPGSRMQAHYRDLIAALARPG